MFRIAKANDFFCGSKALGTMWWELKRFIRSFLVDLSKAIYSIWICWRSYKILCSSGLGTKSPPKDLIVYSGSLVDRVWKLLPYHDQSKYCMVIASICSKKWGWFVRWGNFNFRTTKLSQTTFTITPCTLINKFRVVRPRRRLHILSEMTKNSPIATSHLTHEIMVIFSMTTRTCLILRLRSTPMVLLAWS